VGASVVLFACVCCFRILGIECSNGEQFGPADGLSLQTAGDYNSSKLVGASVVFSGGGLGISDFDASEQLKESSGARTSTRSPSRG
jgi:hypothetical protein